VRTDLEERVRRVPEFKSQVESAHKERRRRLAHHKRIGEIEKRNPLPRSRDIRTEQQLAAMVVEWWVRCGECDVPGLMFFGSKALWVLLSSLSKEATLDSVKKLRQRLGLIAVSDETPFVWSVSIKRMNGVDWHITGQQRDGKEAFSFCGQVFFNKELIQPPQNLPQFCP